MLMRGAGNRFSQLWTSMREETFQGKCGYKNCLSLLDKNSPTFCECMFIPFLAKNKMRRSTLLLYLSVKSEATANSWLA